MSMARDQCYLVVQFVTLTDDELSEMMVVAGWGWSISISLVLLGTYFWPLVNNAPSSDSMDKAIKLRMIKHSMYSVPLGSGDTVGVLAGP